MQPAFTEPSGENRRVSAADSGWVWTEAHGEPGESASGHGGQPHTRSGWSRWYSCEWRKVRRSRALALATDFPGAFCQISYSPAQRLRRNCAKKMRATPDLLDCTRIKPHTMTPGTEINHDPTKEDLL